MDFGEIEQEVSDEFYNFLIINAQRVDAQRVVAVKGRWRWYDGIENAPAPTRSIRQDVLLISGEQYSDGSRTYGGVSIQPYMGAYEGFRLGIDYWYTDNPNSGACFVYSMLIEGEFIQCANENLRVMDFGDTEQEVSGEFYDFLVANAECLPTIADKLTLIAENEQKVFESGRNEGYAHGYDDGNAEGIQEGKKSEYDSFWDVFQLNGNRKYYDRAFRYNALDSSPTWNKDNFKPKYDIKPAGTDAATSMFENFGSSTAPIDMVAHLEKLGVTIDTSQAKGSFHQAFRGDGVTRWGVIDVTQSTNVQYIFYGNGKQKLKRIDMIISAESTPWSSNSFQNQYAITYLRFGGSIGQSIYFQHLNKLDKESIENIIEHLSDTASGKTLTLSKAAVDKAFESSEGANNGSDTSTWLDDKLGYRPNWTITLV